MTVEDIIALARTQVGVKEEPPGSNRVKYNTDYYGSPVSGEQYPWCVVFIWWLFKELNASDLFCGGEKTAWCNFVRDYAKQHNQWVTSGYRPGDLIMFNWNSDDVLDHIGLVAEVNGNALTVIEGNCNDQVSVCTRSGITMVGAYRPNYAGTNVKPAPEKDEEKGRYTVKAGDTLWGIAERFLGAGERYVQIMSANNLMTDMIHPGQVLVIPDGTSVYRTIQITVKSETLELLSIMAEGWNKTIGQVVDALMEDAV